MLTHNSFFLRELVILNGCEGSQAAFKIDASTSLSMTFKRWVNCYIVTFKFNGIKDVENKLKQAEK